MAELWQQQLKRIGDVLSGSASYAPIMKECDRIASAGFAENFRSKQDETGAPWPPHAPYTLRKHGPHPLLILTGRMHAAATNPSHPEHLRELGRQTLRSGVRASVFYAAIHHYGDPASNTPRRRVIYANLRTVSRMQKAIEQGIANMF